MSQPRCDGLPNLPCGRPLSGREGWCLQHGDQEDRDARWLMHGYTKKDIDPYAVKMERLPDAELSDEEQKAFAGFFEEDDINAPAKPEITRPPEARKGNTHRGEARKHRNPKEHGNPTMTPREEAKWAKEVAS